MTPLANVRPILAARDLPAHRTAETAITVTITVDGELVATAMANRIGEALRAVLTSDSEAVPDVVVRTPRGPQRPVALRIHVPSRTAWWRGTVLSLTRLEFELLLHLARDAGRVCTRRELMVEVWQISHAVKTRTLDVHIRRLRNKIGEPTPLIITIRGVGYQLDRGCGLLIEEDSRQSQRRAHSRASSS
jgi:DNA-binding winged helix-turn-helix (wHTH) protein